MPIVSHLLLSSSQSGDRIYVTYQFTDHTGGLIEVSKLVPLGHDTDAEMLSLYEKIEGQLADKEIDDAFAVAQNLQNPDKVAEHQSQADFDRRLLGRLMTTPDAHVFYAGLPFWQAVESRGGANANQRAAYLGVPRVEYDLVDDRFGDVQGIAFFLDNAKDQIWDAPKNGWE